MSSLLIENGLLVTLNEQKDILENGSIYIENSKIIETGNIPSGKYTPEKSIDAEGMIVMPGLINTHHHLYSTFARGLTPPGPSPSNFQEILERLWWKLDYALNAEDVYFSAMIPLMESIRHGCTTIIDHHASPSCSDGSLDIIEKAFRETGLSGCLCYEVSDRNKEGEGTEENERFIKKHQGDAQISSLFGLHASNTLGEETLDRCAAIGKNLNVGFHVHAAEAEVDVDVTRTRFGKGIMQRFYDAEITGKRSIFAHGVHFTEEDMDMLASTDSMLVNNPESNMNNALAISPVLEMQKRGALTGLGTDGMSSHLFSQARAFYMIQRTKAKDPRIAFGEACEMLLENNPTIANRIFEEPRGILAPGYLADIILIPYTSFTDFNNNTLYGQLLFGLAFERVHTTIARGKILMENGQIPHLEETAIRLKARENATKLWARL